MFSYRNSIFSIIYTGNPMRMKNLVADGDAVSLKRKSVDIHIIDIKRLDNGKHSEIIHGFEPPHLMKFEELNLNDCVEFEEGQIFSCSSH
jgi:hypothetical protein